MRIKRNALGVLLRDRPEMEPRRLFPIHKQILTDSSYLSLFPSSPLSLHDRFSMQSSHSSSSLRQDDFGGRPHLWRTISDLPLRGRDHLQRARQLLINRHSSYTGRSKIKDDRVLSDIAKMARMRTSTYPIIADRKGSLPESDDGSASSSHRSLTPLPGNTTNYPFNRDMIDSSDTLRLMSSPQSLSKALSPNDSPESDDRPSDEDVYTTPLAIDDVDPALQDGVALLAAKGTEETISTKRVILASMTSPQQGWEILQGKRDEEVQEQVSILGLEMRTSQESGGTASDISRTPSQSTTGTEKSASDSFGTAASSLQSATSSDTGLPEKELSPAPPSFEVMESAKLFVTTYSLNNEDQSQQRRDESSALRRYHALLELVETETGYAEDLSSLVHVFFHNLSSQAFFEESEYRLKAVCRNAKELFELHSYLARRLTSIVDKYQISQDSEGTDLEKAMRCDDAIIAVAQQLTSAAPNFDLYQLFCSRHAEALLLIREAEKRHGGDDFAAFERMCGNQIRGHAQGSRLINTPSRRSSGGSATPLGLGTLSYLTAVEDSASTPASGTTTPSGSFASVSRRSSGRLLFADYLIKPIQRLCLYPLVLNSLHKYTPADQIFTRKALEKAISAMREIADNVDKASKQREVDLMSELLLIKIEPNQNLPLSFLKSLGNCSLSGTLDVLYHHDVLCPLTAPLRFHRMGLIIWNGFLLVVRVRKNQQLDCKYWFPLSSAELTPLDDAAASPGTETASWATSMQSSKPLVPFAMRVSYFGHHFELSASSDKERIIWCKHLSGAIRGATSVFEEYSPCSLPINRSTIHYSASASIFNYFAANSRTASNSIDALVRLSSASTRASVDRNMIFSEELLSQYNSNGAIGNSGGGYGPVALPQKDIAEALITSQLRQNSTPSIGSAVGAAIGLARMASQVPTAVKRSRRQSMLNLTEIKPTVDVLLSQSPGEFTPTSSSGNSPFLPSLTKRGSTASFRTKDTASSSAVPMGGEFGEASSSGSSSKWKTSLLRRNSRAMSSRNPGGSLSSSPMTSTTDLSQSLKIEVPLSPTLIEGTPLSSPQRPAHVRSKSISLRDVWQNSIGRRSRSQSINTQLTDMSSGPDVQPAPPLSSSPVLDGQRRSDSSESLSSVAHLRRILSATSGQFSSSRSRASGSRFLSDATLNDVNASPPREGSSRRPERSQTAIIFPVLSNLETPFTPEDRRKSEPDALYVSVQRRNSSTAAIVPTTDKSLSPLRRLSRKLSLVGPSSPTTSVVDLANSSMTTLWTDHNRLKSVEEHTVQETSHDNDTQDTIRRPEMTRGRDSAEA
jgi:hypothetical protein